MQKVQGSLIAVRININDEVDVMVRVEGQDIDVLVVDNIKMQSKSKFWQSLINIGGYLGVVILW